MGDMLSPPLEPQGGEEGGQALGVQGGAKVCKPVIVKEEVRGPVGQGGRTEQLLGGICKFLQSRNMLAAF